MPGPKELLSQAPKREFRKELKYLRARRAALDALIRSLETYVRYCDPKANHRGSRAA
jgi:hypothetical protein